MGAMSALVLALTAPLAALAQSPVTGLQGRERDAPPPAVAPSLIDPAQLAAPVGDDRQVLVREFRLQGATAVPTEELADALAPWVGQVLNTQQLHHAAQRLAAVYVGHGRLARVRVVAVQVADGVVDIAIQELRVGRVRIERPDDARATEALVRRFLPADLEADPAASLGDIGRRIAVLDDQPGVAAAAALDAGEKNNEVDLTIRVRDRELLTGSVALDNHGVREIGQTRLQASLRLDNALGGAERFALRALKTEGSAQGVFAASAPVGGAGVRAGVLINHAQLRWLRDGSAMELEGHLTDGALLLRHPITVAGGLALDAEYRLAHTEYADDSIFGPLHDRRIDAAEIELSGNAVQQDTKLDFGAEIARGRADLSGNADDLAQDAVSSRVDGNYWRLRGKLGVHFALGGGALHFNAKGQWADQNLDPTLQFVLGGPGGVRAYPELEGLGDRGWLARLEWRRDLLPGLDGRLFADTGAIARNASPWTGDSNHFALSGAGFGFSWQLPEGFRFETDLAAQIGKSKLRRADGTDSDGRNESWRLWLALSRAF